MEHFLDVEKQIYSAIYLVFPNSNKRDQEQPQSVPVPGESNARRSPIKSPGVQPPRENRHLDLTPRGSRRDSSEQNDWYIKAEQGSGVGRHDFGTEHRSPADRSGISLCLFLSGSHVSSDFPAYRVNKRNHDERYADCAARREAEWMILMVF
jgi:hypothetical protein